MMQALTPLLLLSHGEMDFDCPHVDDPSSKAWISTWMLEQTSWTYCRLETLRDIDGGDLDPTVARMQRISIPEMRERSDNSFNTALLHAKFYLPVQKRETGRLAPTPNCTRLICTPDLFAITMLDDLAPGQFALRPQFGDLNIGPLLGEKMPDEAPILPIIYRSGQDYPVSAHRALELRHQLASQIDAICTQARAVGESVSGALLIS